MSLCQCLVHHIAKKHSKTLLAQTQSWPRLPCGTSEKHSPYSNELASLTTQPSVGAKLAILSGWVGWHTLSSLSIAVTLMPIMGICEFMYAEEGRYDFPLSVTCCPVMQHKQQLGKIQ